MKNNVLSIRIITAFGFLLIFTCCSTSKKVKADNCIQGDTIIYQSSLIEINSNTAYYISESFADSMFCSFENPSDRESFKPSARIYSSNLDCDKRLVLNYNDSTRMDTLYTYSGSGVLVKVRRYENRGLLEKFEISSARFGVDDVLCPGLDRKTFSRIFKQDNIKSDTVCIGDNLKMDYVKFEFRSDSIKRITVYMADCD